MVYPKKKKRFLFVMGYTCPFPGAGWWRIFNFAKNFRDQGHECIVISGFSYNSFNFRSSTFNSPKILQKNGIRIYNIIPYIEFENPLSMAINNALAAITLLPFLLISKANVVFISIPPIDQFIPVFFFSKLLRRKIVVDYRDELEDFSIERARNFAFFYRFLKVILSKIYTKATLVTPVTPAVEDGLKKRGLRNIKVIFDGVDTTIFKPFNRSRERLEFSISKDTFVIAFIGNVYSTYRVDIVVKALKKMKDQNSECNYLFIFAGGGDVKSVLNLALSLGIVDMVKYFGVIKNPVEVAKFLSLADCGVIPYDDNPLWQKTYSTKLFEYCAVGLPVIATAQENSALANLIKEHKLGLVAPPVDIDKLALTIAKLSSNPDLEVEMRSSALKFAQRHDKKEISKDLINAIENSEGQYD